jgi:outer membrane protein
MVKYSLYILVLWSISLSGLSSNAGNPVLDDYVRIGIESNLALRQQRENYHLSLELLNEARSWYYPSLSFNMRYTRARGGRVIEFPAGDLLNPVYSTLNMLTGTQAFPRVENESFYFYRPREQETKLRLAQPIISPEIWYGNRISKIESEIGYLDLEMYARHLVAEIKKAYYRHLQAIRIEQVINESILLVRENIRVNERLVASGMATPDNIHRARAELGKAEQELAAASGNRKISAAWFNFLLNREPGDEIIAMSGEPDITLPSSFRHEDRFDISMREEMVKTEQLVRMSDEYIRLRQSSRYPRLTALVEYGYQGERWSFTGRDDFMLASLVLSWPLFDGFRNNSSVRQAVITRSLAELAREEIEQKLNLEVINAWYELEAAGKAIDAAESVLESAASAFRITDRRFSEGTAPMIEFTDARTGMTAAEINLIISRFDYLSRYAEYERAAALYDLGSHLEGRSSFPR